MFGFGRRWPVLEQQERPGSFEAEKHVEALGVCQLSSLRALCSGILVCVMVILVSMLIIVILMGVLTDRTMCYPKSRFRAPRNRMDENS